MVLFAALLDERRRRLFAGVEALQFGIFVRDFMSSGIATRAQATGQVQISVVVGLASPCSPCCLRWHAAHHHNEYLAELDYGKDVMERHRSQETRSPSPMSFTPWPTGMMERVLWYSFRTELGLLIL